MTNELTQDAEESATIEKTAIEQTESITATAEAVAPAITEAPTPNAEIASAAETESVVSEPTAPEPEPPATSEPVSETSPVVASSETVSKAESVAEPVQPPPVEAKATGPAEVKAPAPSDTLPSGEIDFGAILEQFEQEQTVYHQGELVEGKIVGITDRGILIDFGYKSEGFVPVEEFIGEDGETTAVVGETVEVIIRTIHSGDGAPQLSKTDALGRKVWDEIETAFNAEQPVVGRVVDKTKGGLRVDLNGIEAFLPGSQIDSRPIRSLDTYIGQDIEAQIIKFSRRRNNIVLSRKVITDLVVNEQKAETMSNVEAGYVIEGTIKNLTEYGAFVDIGGIDGLLHVTDMSWGRIHHPGDMFKVGEHLQVKILKLDREKEKISLGFKQLLPDPWSTVVEVYPVNTKLKGIVSSVTEYGVFVELEAGVEGLVHVSEISWSRRSQSPKRLFHKGQEVEVQVLGVDTVEKRISLGMKQFQDNPWDMVDIKYPVGAKIIGRVRNLTDFGAFVELEEGIDGLVHVSDITWTKKIKHPKDVLKKDQEVEAIVTSIDKRGQRLSLSMKDLTPSAWEGFVATHRPGDTVKGKVSRFTNFGVFVELGEGLEGLCHISELSDDHVENAESVATLGQEMDFKILRIEQSEQKIGLSHRAVGKEGEPIADSKMYSTEAKGGMASLGELAKLRRGDGDAEAQVEEDPEAKKKAKQAAKKIKAEVFAAKEAEAAAAAEAAENAETSTEADNETPESDAAPTSETPEATAETAEAIETESEGSTEAESESAAAEPTAEETVPNAADDSASKADSEPIDAETVVAATSAEEEPKAVAAADETAAEGDNSDAVDSSEAAKDEVVVEDAPATDEKVTEAATSEIEEPKAEAAADEETTKESEKKSA